MPRPGFRFTLQTKKLFLTFPQCIISKEVLLLNIQNFSWDLDWAIVCSERHEDGSPHLHAVINLKRMYRTTIASALDVLVGGHGDYQKVKGRLWQAVKYIIKDGDWCASTGFDPDEFVSAGSSKTSTSYATIARLIHEDPSLSPEAVFELAPGKYLKDSAKIKSFMAEVAVWRARRHLSASTWVDIPTADLAGPSFRIAEWLNLNLGKPRSFKQPQLYIYGPVGCGKTHLLNQLEALISMYQIPSSEDWDDGYEDGVFSLAYLDEFKRNKTRSYILQWLQGSTMTLKKKGLPPYVKKQNIPTIFLSNFPLLDLYSDPKYFGTLPALEARFLVVNVGYRQRLDLWPRSLSSVETLSMSSSDDLMLIDASPPDLFRPPPPLAQRY